MPRHIKRSGSFVDPTRHIRVGGEFVALGSGGGPTIPDVTNVEKLSGSYSVGQQVHVTDGFVVSGAGSSRANFFFKPNGTAAAKVSYVAEGTQYTTNGVDGGVISSWNDGITNDSSVVWTIFDNNDALLYWSHDDVEFPWQVTTWRTDDDSGNILVNIIGIAPVPTLTHPAPQQLAAPSATVAGVFVSGGTQDGVYTDRGTHDGKRGFVLLGNGDSGLSDIIFVVEWVTDINAQLGSGPSADGFVITNGAPDLLYYSPSDVATPDLATNWKNASDDSPASITVAAVTQGELDAGLTKSGVFYTNSGTITNGRKGYVDVLGVADPVTFDGTKWSDGTTDGSGNTAVPWDGGFGTRDDVASEANWAILSS